MGKKISVAEFRALAELRYRIRRFLQEGDNAAHEAGLEAQQYLLLLAIRGLPEGCEATVSTLAERLLLRHHSTVELANRLAKGGYVRRQRDQKDRREVLLNLTAKGETILRQLSLDHRQELRTAGPALMAALERVLGGRKYQVFRKA